VREGRGGFIKAVRALMAIEAVENVKQYLD
jgi:hypothetical protein